MRTICAKYVCVALKHLMISNEILNMFIYIYSVLKKINGFIHLTRDTICIIINLLVNQLTVFFQLKTSVQRKKRFLKCYLSD